MESVSGSLIVRNIDINTNCASKFTASVSIEKNKITITQTDISTQKMKCNCNIDLDISINHISQGDYRLIVLREELKRFGYPKDTVYQVHSQEIKVKSSGSRLQSAYSLEQSDCKQNLKSSQTKPLGNEVFVFPNPAESNINISFELKNDCDVTVQLFNFLGKQVTSFNRKGLSAGTQTITVQGKELQPGMYIGKLITSDGRVSNFRLTWNR